MGGDIERPSKVRRLSDESNVFACLQDDNQATPCPPTKGKTMDFKVTTASLNSGENSKRPDDYSAYKGRGRYSGQIQYVAFPISWFCHIFFIVTIGILRRQSTPYIR